MMYLGILTLRFLIFIPVAAIVWFMFFYNIWKEATRKD
jgi:hypothetical protein